MRICRSLPVLLALLASLVAARPLGAQMLRGLAPATPTEAAAERAAEKNLEAYTLPPEKMAKAVALNHIEQVLTLSGWLWTPVQLVLLLAFGIVAWIRDVAVRMSRNRWVQGFVFLLLLLALHFVLNLPLMIYAHHIGLAYGLSVQGWASWLGDHAKSLMLNWAIGGLLMMLLFWLIRRSPKRWWLWLWPLACLVGIAGVFLTPYVIDPLFNHFESLSASDPALVDQLERVVARSGMTIPPERMFLMRASDKYTGLNAYVTGFGASKRIVVWDTTVAKAKPDEILFVFAHELGHYALNHIVEGEVLACVAMLPLFWLGYRGTDFLLRRFGATWKISGQQDWGALAVLLLVFSLLSMIGDPLGSAFSRRIEHNADVYGLEAVHGIVGDPQAVGRASFQVLGEESFDDPRPHPVFDFWFGDHPPIWFRAAFTEAYDPWVEGQQPKYFDDAAVR